jgi:hypothetical protein
MLMVVLKSGLVRVWSWAVECVLGSLARVSVLTADHDMCLLLRVEMPRGRTSPPG